MSEVQANHGLLNKYSWYVAVTHTQRHILFVTAK